VQLKSVRVQNYRSIDDSGVVPIDDITCMVGKNEAGKTAFLQALHLLNPLNPINGKTEYDDVMDYPSKRFAAYKRVREDEPANVVTAEFELTDKEVAKIEAALGAGVMKSRRVTVKKGYNGTIYYTSSTDVQVAIAHLTSSVEHRLPTRRPSREPRQRRNSSRPSRPWTSRTLLSRSCSRR
jgi:predicted ATP-dependent endonuclease of OLD family